MGDASGLARPAWRARSAPATAVSSACPYGKGSARAGNAHRARDRGPRRRPPPRPERRGAEPPDAESPASTSSCSRSDRGALLPTRGWALLAEGRPDGAAPAAPGGESEGEAGWRVSLTIWRRGTSSSTTSMGSPATEARPQAIGVVRAGLLAARVPGRATGSTCPRSDQIGHDHAVLPVATGPSLNPPERGTEWQRREARVRRRCGGGQGARPALSPRATSPGPCLPSGHAVAGRAEQASLPRPRQLRAIGRCEGRHGGTGSR